jgi:hypothetical protein
LILSRLRDMKFRGLGVVSLLVLACSLLHGQATPNVSLSGVLQGPNGLPVSNAVISLTPTQSFFVSGSGPTCGSYVFQVNGVGLTCADKINFNKLLPLAPTNGLNVQFATVRAGTTDSVSAALVGDGNPLHYLSGTGIWSIPPGGGGSGGGVAAPIVAFTNQPAGTAVNLTTTFTTTQLVVQCWDANNVAISGFSPTLSPTTPYTVSFTFAAIQSGTCTALGPGSTTPPPPPAGLFTVTPSLVPFNTVPIGTTSAPQVISLTNNTAATITSITPFPISGTNPADSELLDSQSIA